MYYIVKNITKLSVFAVFWLVTVKAMAGTTCVPQYWASQKSCHFSSSSGVFCRDISLQRVLALINRYEEGKRLLEKASETGPIAVKWAPLGTNGAEALWDDNTRSVVVNSNRSSTDGQRVCWILFEIHNAMTTAEFDSIVNSARNGYLSKDDYVRAVEEHEHRNALAASQLLKRGVESGHYPNDALWPVIKDFEDHYRMQQLMGHSLWIADQYDQFFLRKQIAPYHGTIPGLAHLLENEKELLLRYLVAKQALKQGNSYKRQRASRFLQEEYLGAHKMGNTRKLQLLDTVIGKTLVEKFRVTESSPCELRG